MTPCVRSFGKNVCVSVFFSAILSKSEFFMKNALTINQSCQQLAVMTHSLKQQPSVLKPTTHMTTDDSNTTTTEAFSKLTYFINKRYNVNCVSYEGRMRRSVSYDH